MTNFFPIVSRNNKISGKISLSVNSPAGVEGYKTEGAARGAMKRKFGEGVSFVVLQYSTFKEASDYA